MKKIFNNCSRDGCPEKNKKKKFDFNKRKENTIKSLKDVESFLRNFKNMTKYIKLYKIIK